MQGSFRFFGLVLAVAFPPTRYSSPYDRNREILPVMVWDDYRLLDELKGVPGPEKSKRVTDAMLKMQKIIVTDLQKVYDG